MRILVTGGAGFIGSAVIAELQKYDNQIYVIDNLSFGNRKFIDVNDECFFKDDILNRPKMFEIFDKIKPELVIHLAAIHFIPFCNEHPYESSNINIQGTINVLDAAQKSGIKKLIFASTAAVYPIYDDAVSEEHEVNPLDIYGLSKLAGERLCNEFYLISGIPTIVCRFFNAFGPNETNPHLIPEIQKQINEGLRTIKLGNLTPKRDFIHTQDMAKAIKLLSDKPMNDIQTYNLGRGIEYSVIEIVEAFERQLGEKIVIEQEQSRIRKVERMHLLADVSKLKTQTGWEPTWSIDDGVKTLLEFK